MKYLISQDIEYLNKVNSFITEKMKEHDKQFNAKAYSEILQGENCYALPFDENDLRNPFQYLAECDIQKMADYFEVNNG